MVNNKVDVEIDSMNKATKELKKLFDTNQDWKVCKRSNLEVLNECTKLLENRSFQEVITKIIKYTQENRVLDIQLFCLYLQAYFNLNNSAGNFVSTLSILTEILDNYQLISPINKKSTIVLRSVIALINESNNAINYYYPDFLDKQLQQVKEFLEQVKEFLACNIQEVDLTDFNSAKNKLLITVSKYVLKENIQLNRENTDNEKDDISLVKLEKENRYSFYWTNLLLRVARFVSLANSLDDVVNKFELALLFDSIQTEIQDFNPIKYFPNEFQGFLNSVTPETYSQIQQIIENSKGSALWEFMLQKTQADIEINPGNKKINAGDFNIDDILQASSYKKHIENKHDEKINNYEVSQRNNDEDFSPDFNILDL
ncbi:type VI secretion system protein IglI family protein [Allofrancisella guangzhouensis]|nr:type VI secretion system protein IglI family protein [Allofrancisella guangzhouensis]